MKREILTEHRRKSFQDPEAAIQLHAQHPTTGDSLPSPPAHIVLVPPIRSFCIRDALHNTSNATLRPRTDGQREEDPQAGHASDPAATITEAIAKLENVLEEACRLAQSVSEAEQFATAPADRTIYGRRRPSETITKKGFRYLEHAGKHSSACDSAHGQQQPTKSKVAAPHMTSPSEVFEVDHLQVNTDTVRRSKSGLEIISPRRDRDPSLPQRPSQECHPGSNISMSKADVKEYIRKHAALPITPRASSRERVLPPDPAYFNVPPILKLNDEAFNDDESKHRDQQRLLHAGQPEHHGSFSQMFGTKSRHASIDLAKIPPAKAKTIDLKRVNHVDL
jgi:hypothetical protein